MRYFDKENHIHQKLWLNGTFFLNRLYNFGCVLLLKFGAIFVQNVEYMTILLLLVSLLRRTYGFSAGYFLMNANYQISAFFSKKNSHSVSMCSDNTKFTKIIRLICLVLGFFLLLLIFGRCLPSSSRLSLQSMGVYEPFIKNVVNPSAKHLNGFYPIDF